MALSQQYDLTPSYDLWHPHNSIVMTSYKLTPSTVWPDHLVTVRLLIILWQHDLKPSHDPLWQYDLWPELSHSHSPQRPSEIQLLYPFALRISCRCRNPLDSSSSTCQNISLKQWRVRHDTIRMQHDRGQHWGNSWRRPVYQLRSRQNVCLCTWDGTTVFRPLNSYFAFS